MASKPSERFAWAVDVLALDLSAADLQDAVARSIAVIVPLVSRSHTSDTATPSLGEDDRDGRRRNREHVASGKAALRKATLEEADLGDEPFDKVFAFNVAPFWLRPREALGIVRDHLAPGGLVHVFWDARHTPSGELADRLVERIRLADFTVHEVLVQDLRPVPAVCVIGRP